MFSSLEIEMCDSLVDISTSPKMKHSSTHCVIYNFQNALLCPKLSFLYILIAFPKSMQQMLLIHRQLSLDGVREEGCLWCFAPWSRRGAELTERGGDAVCAPSTGSIPSSQLTPLKPSRVVSIEARPSEYGQKLPYIVFTVWNRNVLLILYTLFFSESNAYTITTTENKESGHQECDIFNVLSGFHHYGIMAS